LSFVIDSKGCKLFKRTVLELAADPSMHVWRRRCTPCGSLGGVLGFARVGAEPSPACLNLKLDSSAITSPLVILNVVRPDVRSPAKLKDPQNLSLAMLHQGRSHKTVKPLGFGIDLPLLKARRGSPAASLVVFAKY